MVTRSSQQQEDTSLAVLDLVVALVDSLYTLAQLSFVSKRCRSICAAHATHQLQALLLPALRQAAVVPASSLHQQHMDSIKWLCSVAGKEAFRAASAAVQAIPNVPTGAVRMLTAAGVHVSDAAVLAAALKQQPGVEAWLQAHEPAVTPLASLAAQLRSPAGLLQESAAAAAAGACAAAGQAPLLELLKRLEGCGRVLYLPWMLFCVHPSHVPALLRIAVNQRDAAAATAIVKYLTSSDNDFRLSGLEQAWQAHKAYGLSLQDEQHSTESTVAAAQLLQEHSERQQLLTIHAQQLQQVTSQLLDELLLLAVARQHSRLIAQLLLFPAVEQLQSSTVAALLHCVVCSNSVQLHPARDTLLHMLCQLPAAADIGAQQLASLLLEAVTRRQLMSTCHLQQLPAAEQLSSEQVLLVALAAVRSSCWDALGGEALGELLHQLTPQHYYELLHEAVLMATFAGAGMLGMWCHAGPSVPVTYAAIDYQFPGTPDARAVIKVLCVHDAAYQVDVEHVEQLLQTAAALGNTGALAVLCKHLIHLAGVEQDVHLQLLETALQLRNSSMAQVVAAQVSLNGIDCDDISEAVMGLARTDDRQQLFWAVDMVHTAYASQCMYQLLHTALQLRRGGLVACLCSKQWSSAAAAAKGLSAKQLTSGDLTHLLRLAVRNNCHSAVQRLLQLPTAAGLPYGGLYLVIEESRRLGGLQQACLSNAALWWSRRSRWPTPQHLLPQLLLQQQQRLPVQQPQPADQQQQVQQAQQELDVVALLQEMLSGQFPSSSARAMLQRAGAAARSTGNLSDEEWQEVWEVHGLLEAAVQQLPAGKQQRAWVWLLVHSEFVAHVDPNDNTELLLAAVHAACSSGWTGSLRVLCTAWPDASNNVAYTMAAAAVQLGCFAVVRLLLQVPAVQQALTVDQVASLLRWGIHSSSRGVLENITASALDSSSCCRPPAPGCTAAHAEVFAAVCKLPAVQQVAGVQLVGLLLRAMQQGNVEAVQQLCRLAGAQQLDTALVRGCLCFARVLGSRPGRDAVVGALCSLRGGQGLRAADVGELLQLYDGVDGLMGWAAAESQEAGVEPAESRLTRVL